MYKKIGKSIDHIVTFDEEIEYDKKFVSGKADYVERNQAMINASDYCVFYYDKNYLPSRRKHSKKEFFDYQPNSGTKIAYEYAMKKINI